MTFESNGEPEINESEQRYTNSLTIIDNYHSFDESEDSHTGPFPSCEAAADHARQVISRWIQGIDLSDRKHSTREKLIEELILGWKQYGETPVPVTNDPDCVFSGTETAEQAIADYVRANTEQT